ncbi:hypothetical protein ACFGZ0_06260 [Pasteurella multocida]|uniref:DUF7210 family protein n=1 Tax=Pasteurella multocida TaxID=747 RepID=UPI000CF2CD1B|nr:hypothetical protein [Pasteurella multocida]MEB3501432.1 hypothetical protein [Pasteurella multocida]HDR1062617.1 hypothetical protein [Pasteurella multocida]
MKKVKLLKSHIHAGVSHSAGDVLDVTDADAQFITSRGIGEFVKKKKDDSKEKDKKSTSESDQKQAEGDNKSLDTDNNLNNGENNDE